MRVPTRVRLIFRGGGAPNKGLGGKNPVLGGQKRGAQTQKKISGRRYRQYNRRNGRNQMTVGEWPRTRSRFLICRASGRKTGSYPASSAGQAFSWTRARSRGNPTR